MIKNTNEYDPELVGIHSMVSFIQHVSSSRSQMFSSHYTQRVGLLHPDKPHILSGTEFMMAKYALNGKLNERCKIIRIIPRCGDPYTKMKLPNMGNSYPETMIIYETESGVFDCVVINYYETYHTHFGFKNVFTKDLKNLTIGDTIEPDTVLTTPPSIVDGEFCYGKNLNMAFITNPAVAEDGVLISKSAAKSLSYAAYDKRDIILGKAGYPLNTYGDDNNYKIFPDIGEYVNDTSAIMFKRRVSHSNKVTTGKVGANKMCDTAVSMNLFSTRKVEHYFDEGVYIVRPNARVIDIKVFNNANNAVIPPQMTGQLNLYRDAMLTYCRSIVAAYDEVIKMLRNKYHSFKEAMHLGDEFVNQYVHAMMLLENAETGRPKLSHKLDPADEYRIEITTESILTPKIGGKLTDKYGSKGVICHIEEDDRMPVDERGIRADIIMDPSSTIARMNVGKLYESYYSCGVVDINRYLKQNKDKLTHDQMFDYVLGFTKIVSPPHYNSLLQITDKHSYVDHILETGFRLFFPSNNPADDPTAVQELETSVYKPHFGKVTYTGYDGRKITTSENVRISPMYIMVLQQIANEFLSVASSSLQHFGMPGPTTKSQKFAKPYKANPVRNVGETESRLYLSYLGRDAMAELLDRTLNIETHKEIYKSLLTVQQPTNTTVLIDRAKMPFNHNKPLTLLTHLMASAGIKIVYEKES